MNTAGIFISKPIDGLRYIAERSRKGRFYLLWSVIPIAPLSYHIPIDAGDVPHKIRKEAYRTLHKETKETTHGRRQRTESQSPRSGRAPVPSLRI